MKSKTRAGVSGIDEEMKRAGIAPALFDSLRGDAVAQKMTFAAS
jgi:hypothetical protein